MGQSQPLDRESDELLGATINGRFKIISLIARGGMGKVYKAEQSALGRTCALKVLNPYYEGARDPEFHRRFSLEAATAAKLTHPNTVTIFDYGKCEEHEIYYIAMEYLDGRTLHSILHDEKTLSEERVSHIAQQICRSVGEAHRLGVVHRDLKPSNVLLVDRGDDPDFVKVLDFGLVKDVTGKTEELTQTGLFLGSPKYMAPEQVLGGEVSPRTDIYALGVIMYEMLSGNVPFDRKAGMSTLVAHVNEAPQRLGERKPDLALSAEMESLVMRCLEKDPQRRYGSMKELLAALKRAGGDLTETSESLLRVQVDAELLRSQQGGAQREGVGVSATRNNPSSPPPASSTLTVPGIMPAPGSDLLTSPSQISRTLTVAAPSASASARPYAIAVMAALLGGVVAATALSRRGDRVIAHEALPVSAVPPTVAVAIALPPSADPPRMGPGVRILTVESDPPGAGVSDQGIEVCTKTPCRVYWTGDSAQGAHRLTLSKRGYRTTTVDVPADADKVMGKLEPPEVGATLAPSAAAPELYGSARPDARTTATVPPSSLPATTTSPLVTTFLQADPLSAPTAAKTAESTAPAVAHLEEGMTRPTRLSGEQPIYPREAREAKVAGTVVAKCVIGTTGMVSGCRILRGLPFMDQPVLSALASWRYTPARRDNTPVAVDYVITIKLTPP